MTREEYNIGVLQDLKSAICENLVNDSIEKEIKQALDMAIKSLEQEPKQGHWIEDKTIYNWRCSECGELPMTLGYVGDRHFMKAHFKFCNHCGARMEEVSE